jgi:hypothetical protein
VHSTAGSPQRATAGLDARSVAPASALTATLRVDGNQPADRGVFETFLGSLIGFLFT